METMLISCYFNGEKCNLSDFYYFHSFEYGNCYTFNYNLSSIRYTSKYGPSSGLSMELFVGVSGFELIIIKKYSHISQNSI